MNALQGNWHLLKGDPETSSKGAQWAEAKGSPDDNEEVLVATLGLWCLFFQAVAWYRQGNTSEALEMLQFLLTKSHIDKSRSQLAAACTIELAGSRMNHGYFDEAIEQLSQITNQLSDMGIWHLTRHKSTVSISCQATGRYLEARHALSRTTRVLSRRNLPSLQSLAKRHTLSLAIESEDFAKAVREADLYVSGDSDGAATQALWLLEHLRLNLARGHHEHAQILFGRLQDSRNTSAMSVNVLAAIEEDILLEIHARRFDGLAQRIEHEIAKAQSRADVALTMVLRVWLVRTLIESRDYAAARAAATLASVEALQRPSGKVRARAKGMHFAATFLDHPIEQWGPWVGEWEREIQSCHLPLHGLVVTAVRSCFMGETTRLLAPPIASIVNRGEIPFLRALLHEYGLLGAVAMDNRPIEDFCEHVQRSADIIHLARERSILFWESSAAIREGNPSAPIDKDTCVAAPSLLPKGALPQRPPWFSSSDLGHAFTQATDQRAIAAFVRPGSQGRHLCLHVVKLGRAHWSRLRRELALTLMHPSRALSFKGIKTMNPVVRFLVNRLATLKKLPKGRTMKRFRSVDLATLTLILARSVYPSTRGWIRRKRRPSSRSIP